MENEINFLDPLFCKVEDYGKTNFQLYKLKSIDKISTAFSSLVYQFILFSILAIILIFINIGVALWIGKILNENYIGFMCIASFYTMLFPIVCLCKKRIKNKAKNAFIVNSLN